MAALADRSPRSIELAVALMGVRAASVPVATSWDVMEADRLSDGEPALPLPPPHAASNSAVRRGAARTIWWKVARGSAAGNGRVDFVVIAGLVKGDSEVPPAGTACKIA